MVLGMLIGAGLLLLGFYLGYIYSLSTRVDEVVEIKEEFPLTLDGKYYSTKVAMREAMGRGEDD